MQLFGFYACSRLIYIAYIVTCIILIGGCITFSVLADQWRNRWESNQCKFINCSNTNGTYHGILLWPPSIENSTGGRYVCNTSFTLDNSCNNVDVNFCNQSTIECGIDVNDPCESLGIWSDILNVFWPRYYIYLALAVGFGICLGAMIIRGWMAYKPGYEILEDEDIKA